MYKTYISAAFRSLRKEKGYAAISLFGLAIGMACCVLIFLFVRNEWAVNTQFADVEQIYRVDSQWREETMGLPMTTLAPIGQTLVQEYPEVTEQVRLYLMSSSIRVEEDSRREVVMLADTSFLQLFDLPLIEGDASTAMMSPRSLLLAEDLAISLFGTHEAVGETVMLETWNNGWQPFTVTGVWKTLSQNSVTRFGKENYKLLISPYPFGDYVGEPGWSSWESRYIMQFVKIGHHVDPLVLSEKLDGFIESYAPEAYHGNLQIKLNPLRTLFLSENENQGWRMIQLLLVMGVLVLLIACINFTNLAVGQSMRRIKEIGVRKAIGAQRSQLLKQFFTESFVKSAIAVLCGGVIAVLCFKPFFSLFQKEIVLESLLDSSLIGVLVGLVVVVGVISGAYPALLLSSYQPIKAIKGRADVRGSLPLFRRILVVAQFTVAIVLMVSVLTIMKQLSFIQGKDLGFDKDHLLVIESVPRVFNEEGVARMEVIKERLSQMAGVQSVSLSWETAGEESGNSLAVSAPGQGYDESIGMSRFVVDHAFKDTYNLKLRAGTFFSEGRSEEPPGVVLNETAARTLGWSAEEAIGQLIQVRTTSVSTDEQSRHIVLGVLADHHFQSLHEPIRPLIYLSVDEQLNYRVLGIKLASSNPTEMLTSLHAIWQDEFPNTPFEYVFLDDRIDEAYQSEQQVKQLVGLGALLTIFISCMGMLGLASLSVARRTKEIGIRKVVGASVSDIVVLLSRDVFTTTFLAMMIATPIAYVAMQHWLDGYAYREGLSAIPFLIAGIVTIGMGWLTVSFHTIQAAVANPVKALRHE